VDFRAEYEAKIAWSMEPGSRAEVLRSLDHFERIVKPVRVASIKPRRLTSSSPRGEPNAAGSKGTR